MANIQRINIIVGQYGSRNRRRIKANQRSKKLMVSSKSNISTNRNNLISGVDRCIHLNAMKKTNITSINRQTIKIFFFQAEDGIRDVAVTGVQTCALPI